MDDFNYGFGHSLFPDFLFLLCLTLSLHIHSSPQQVFVVTAPPVGPGRDTEMCGAVIQSSTSEVTEEIACASLAEI